MQNIPQKGRVLGHVTPQMFGIRSNISSKLHGPETSNLVASFALANTSGRTNNIPQKGRGVGHVTPQTYLQNYFS